MTYYYPIDLHIGNSMAVKCNFVKLVNGLLWAMENQKVTSVVILDLSATFNTIDHELLLQVLTQ